MSSLIFSTLRNTRVPTNLQLPDTAVCYTYEVCTTLQGFTDAFLRKKPSIPLFIIVLMYII